MIIAFMVSRFVKVLTIDRKIHNQNTGTAELLAKQLNISRSNLFEILSELKDYGADLRFDRSRKTFFYANDFKISFIIEVDGCRILCNDDFSKTG